MTARRSVGERALEATCGGLAAILGGGGLAVALFANIMVSVGSTVVTRVPLCVPSPCVQASIAPIPRQTITHSSIAAGGITGGLEVFVIVVSAVLVAIAVGAVFHGLTSRLPWLVLLCSATGVLLLGTLLSGFSIGLFFVPADVLAIAAVALGLAQAAPPPRPVTFPGR
jgi:hypothetical protein